MNEIGEKFLPVGTVVMLNGGTKRVMITGFCSAAQEEPNKVWDYTGCPYPEGYITSDQTCLFNHDQISKIHFIGFKEDEEEKVFKETLNKLFDALAKSATLEKSETDLETETEVLAA